MPHPITDAQSFPVRLPDAAVLSGFTAPPVASTPQIDELIAAGAPVAVGISGGKDSQACAHRVFEHLDSVGHTGKRLLVHSDLGRIEWEQSLPACERLARNLKAELLVVRRAAGDMIERWETRWANNVRRYANLECVQLILPWSTPAMRFCTSELKTAVICAELTRRFPGQRIISATGIRREESAGRAKAPIAAPQPKLTARGSSGLNWNPILEWSLKDVLSYISAKGEVLHPAYTWYGCSRVSCAFCIMSAHADLRAASHHLGNVASYRRLVNLEIASSFGFQGSRWLADVAPGLLEPHIREAIEPAKAAVRRRVEVQARIPRELLYTAGWPTMVPSPEQAQLLAEVRREVAQAVGICVDYVDADSIIERYEELIAKREAKLAGKNKRTPSVPVPLEVGALDPKRGPAPNRIHGTATLAARYPELDMV